MRPFSWRRALILWNFWMFEFPPYWRVCQGSGRATVEFFGQGNCQGPREVATGPKYGFGRDYKLFLGFKTGVAVLWPILWCPASVCPFLGNKTLPSGNIEPSFLSSEGISSAGPENHPFPLSSPSTCPLPRQNAGSLRFCHNKTHWDFCRLWIQWISLKTTNVSVIGGSWVTFLVGLGRGGKGDQQQPLVVVGGLRNCLSSTAIISGRRSSFLGRPLFFFLGSINCSRVVWKGRDYSNSRRDPKESKGSLPARVSSLFPLLLSSFSFQDPF